MPKIKWNGRRYKKLLIFLFLINSFGLLGANEKVYWTYPASNTCDYLEGDLTFSSVNVNDPLIYQIQYFLTDTSNIILQVSNQPFFYGVTKGDYFIYALAYEINEPITGNFPGNPIANVQSKCSTLSDKATICVCANPPTQRLINGRIFRDTNEDGIDNDKSTNLAGIQVRIFEDIDQNGLIDNTDGLLTTLSTNASGHYSYTIDEIILGRFISHFVVETDTSSIPTNFYLTTDNIETALFAPVDSIDLGNDFGISHSIDIKNQVWLDLNGNGLQEFTEVPLANLDICIANLSPLLIEGILYPPNAFMDTITTDTSGFFAFNKLPDCEWQFVVHYDSAQYVPTYDADGGILSITNFTTNDGAIKSDNNEWCDQEDCSTDLNYGFGLAGEFSLSGQICIDDLTKDGTCNTDTETYFKELVVNIFDDSGKKLGGVITNENGAYEFPNLFAQDYIVELHKVQNSLEDYLLTTTEQSNAATVVTTTSFAIFQKVTVLQNVGGIDYAFILHIKTIKAKNDFLKICSYSEFENNVSLNDSIDHALVSYEIVASPQYGTTQMDVTGLYQYKNTIPNCQMDQFTYKVCDLVSEDCDEATVFINLQDTITPTLMNLPEDLVFHCNEFLPVPPLVSAFDDCPNIKLDVEENNTQGEDGCSLYDYQLYRTWIARDACGNSEAHTQTIEIKDIEAPNIFRIYTLANGKKLVAGVTTLTPSRWKKIILPIKFDTQPLIFSQIITNEITTPCVVQKQKISKSQFEMRIEQITDESESDSNRYEKVVWIALEAGIASNTAAATFELSSNANDMELSFDASTVNLFTSQQTTNQKSPTLVDWKITDNLTTSINLIELINDPLNPIESTEKIAYWQVPQQTLLANETEEIIGETGITQVGAEWSTITLQNTYYNPIIITNTPLIGEVPVILNIQKVSSNTFEIKGQTLSAPFPDHAIQANYLVVEGSIPLDGKSAFCETGTEGLVLGRDIKAIDNCDQVVDLSYEETFQQNGLIKTTKRCWRSTDECGNKVSYEQIIDCEGVGVQLKTYLQGALLNSKEPNLMRDDLRRKKLIPLEDPYFYSSTLNKHRSDTPQQMVPSLLDITGPNAIVDWVYIDLRSATDIESVVGANIGLLQRDGDIISHTGDSIIVFDGVPFGDYYIGVHHRNHLGLLTKNAQYFDYNAIPEIDFKNIFTPVSGNRPTIQINNQNAQWSGDVSGDGKIIFQGPNNDPFHILLEILLDDNNAQFLTNYISRGYSDIDFDMDGIIIFQGPNNDRSNLLYNTILVHPDNTKLFTNFIIDNN